ncbi:hypothetical protein J5Y09_03470 [Roseomonas sp. PWR1]|uniref:Uncharacterized protein n=1 Tax=Roseomonas nitratireducens TaxID=2820810 RepID=A0ABS4AP03_9PROT|nr:hypothetical protein [Neoroseomonas nitratireducens]MBP0462959.1 hypothetical protein [Neoroseomonas nitratireducens]
MVLGTGQVLFFFSETVFFAHWRPLEDSIGSRLVTWLTYSVLGYLVLAAVAAARLRNGRELVLAGALFGWLAEGGIAGTLFGYPSMPFPYTIVWPALAWHMPVSLLAGWWAIGLALRAPRAWAALGWSVALGVFWGVWAFSWRFNDPPLAMPHPAFVQHALVTTGGLLLGHVCVWLGRPASFRPRRGSVVLAGLAVAAVFFGVVVPRVPAAPLLLAALLGLVWLLLRRAGAPDGPAPVLLALAAPPRPWNLAMLVALPLTAAGVFHGIEGLGHDLPTHPLIVILSMAGGSVAFLAVAARGAFTRRGRAVQ